MSHPFPPLASQDFNDDDAQVIDDLVKATSAPADIKSAIEPVTDPPHVKPNPVTKLQAATVTLSGGAEPFPVLNEDPYRINCKVKIYSTGATPGYNDFVIISDVKGNIAARSASVAIVGHHSQTIDLDGHTGQIWVTPGPGISASIEVTAHGVSIYPDTKVTPV